MSEYIAPYILKSEYQCNCGLPGCPKLPPRFEQNIGKYIPIFGAFKVIRERFGSPIPISSGYRCIAHNNAIPGSSPCSAHLFGVALDLDCDSAGMTLDLYKVIQEVIPWLRVGLYYKKQTFIHIDMAFLISHPISMSWIEHMRWGDDAASA